METTPDEPRWRPPAVAVAAMAAALLFLAGALGWALRGATGDGPSPSEVDLGFAYDMGTHHEQAVEMALTALTDAADPLTRHFAKEVLVSQRYELGQMAAWLEGWGRAPDDRPATAMGWMDGEHGGAHAGHGGGGVAPGEMPGMATEAELAALRQADGRDVDALFYRLMVEHHQGGIPMAEEAAARAEDPRVRALAARIAKVQAVEIRELRGAQARLGLPAA